MISIVQEINRGDALADLVIENGVYFDVFTGQFVADSIGIFGDTIVGFGKQLKGRGVLDAQGLTILPGFIDGHIHIESSMLTPTEFAKLVVRHGTTAVVADPHEICNVFGEDGFEYMVEASGDLPVDILFTVPSCVPATTLETSGAKMEAGITNWLLDRHERSVGLAEFMDFPAVIRGDDRAMSKIFGAGTCNYPIDGHAPGLSGPDLCTYIHNGPMSDHECTTAEEATEKLRRGMHIMIREGSVTKDLEALHGIVTEMTCPYLSLVCDDRTVTDLLAGHLDVVLTKAVSLGIPASLAIRMATINTARYFRLWGRGAIAPGYKADLAIVKDVSDFIVVHTVKSGSLVTEDSLDTYISWVEPPKKEVKLETINGDLEVEHQGGKIRVIDIPDEGTVVTSEIRVEPSLDGDLVVADRERDIAKVVVYNRHTHTSYFVAFVHGMKMKNGAIASTICHDSHNLICVGTSDLSIQKAAHAMVGTQGGISVHAEATDRTTLMHLDVAGLMSSKGAQDVSKDLRYMLEEAKLVTDRVEPFMSLSFLGLSVIPDLKISDRGLVKGGGTMVPLRVDDVQTLDTP